VIELPYTIHWDPATIPLSIFRKGREIPLWWKLRGWG
jgi:hypothetical protein